MRRALNLAMVSIILASLAVPFIVRDEARAQTGTQLWVYTFGDDSAQIAAIADPNEVYGFVWGPTSVAADYTVDIEPGWDEADLDPVIAAADNLSKPVKLQIYSEWGSSYANNIITDNSTGGPQDIFIDSVVDWLHNHSLSGIELDLEADEDLNDAAEVQAYGSFIEHLYTHISANWTLSVNGSWRHPNLPSWVAPYLDYYTVGCYDFDGSTGGGATWPWYGTLSNIQTVISRYHTTQANGSGGFAYDKLGIGTSLAIYNAGGWTHLGYDAVVAAGGTYYLDNAWGEYTYNGLNLMMSKASWSASVGLRSFYLYNWYDYDVPNDSKSAVTNCYAALGSPAPPPPTTTPPTTPAVPQPTSTTDQIVAVGSFADLAEDGDVSISFHWDLSAYGENSTYPDTPASLSILFQLISTDNTTILSTATPYVYAPFQTNGYGHGVSAFYFSAADNLTWGQAYFIRIVQNPTYFESPTTQSYSMAAADWIGDQDDMYDWYIQRCDFLLAEYPTVNLKASTDIGLVFSTYGEAYFRAAVPGIQSLCPRLFYIQDYYPVEMTVTPYDLTLQSQYSVRMQGSEIKRGADRLMTYFGLTGYFGLGFLILGACVASGVYTSKRGWGLEPGLIGASIISVGGALLIGNAVFTIVMIGSLVAVIALMFTWMGRRA